MPGGLGFGEIVLILILALVIFGPRRLPEMGRSIGRSLREFRRAASDLRAEIEEDVVAEPPKPPPAPAVRKRPGPGDIEAGETPEAPPAGDPTPD
jgi:TatA/E family protein of Tat protein translocase